MNDYIGLDVSMKETAVSIRRLESARAWQVRVRSKAHYRLDPANMLRHGQAGRVPETGPLSVLVLSRKLTAEGLLAICTMRVMPKRHSTWLLTRRNANDADGLAPSRGGRVLPGRCGVKGSDSMLARTLVAARTRLVRITTELSNQIRGFRENLRTAFYHPCRQGSFHVREKCSRTPRRSGSVRSDRAAASGYLARNTHPRRGTGRRTSRWRAREQRVSNSRRRSPVSARSPRPRSRPRSKIRRTLENHALSVPGWA